MVFTRPLALSPDFALMDCTARKQPMRNLIVGLLLMLVLGACGQLQLDIVPTTGDTALDAAAAQSQMPNFSNYGYSTIDASSVTDAITALGGSASLLSGNP